MLNKEVLRHRAPYNGAMFPFIKVQDEFFISRNELLLWAQDVSVYHRRYINGQLQ